MYANTEVDNLSLFDEILHLLKEFFIQRNLDGKSLFKVLSKEKGKGKYISEEILFKVLELIFTVSFMKKTHSFFDFALNHFEASAN